LTKSELSTAKDLYDTKYSKSTWNLRNDLEQFDQGPVSRLRRSKKN